MKVPTFSFLVILTLVFALTVIWAGGQISMVVTDSLQGILCYPIFVIFAVFILLKFSWFDEIVPTLSNRVPGESFLNPFDVSELRDFNLFAVFVTMFGMVLNRSIYPGGGVLIQRTWPDHVYPFLQSMGWAEGLDRFLRVAASPFVPYIRWEMNPVKFPINSTEISFIAMLCSVLAYRLVSLLTCRQPYDLDKLLHRGKYNIEHKNEEQLKWTWKTFLVKIIGITPEYRKGDRFLAWSVFIYSFVYSFLLMFVGVVVWNLISPWPVKWWGYYYFITTVVVGSIIGTVSTVWFMWGGIRDMLQMFRDLAARKADPDDNGVIRKE